MDESLRTLVMTGGIAAVVAALAWVMDWRRIRRRDLDRVGWVPWTTLFFWALMAAVVLLGLAVQQWRTG